MTFSTIPETSFVNNVDLHQAPSHDGDTPPQGTHAPRPASGEKAKARAILAAIRTLQAIEQAQRPATPEERAVLARFPGFGPVALGIFPDPVTGQYKDADLADAGGPAPGAPDAGGLRQRQAHHLYGLLHLAAGHPGDARGPRTPGRARRCHRAGARLRHREFPGPRPGGHALHRRGAGQPLRTYRPRAATPARTSASKTSATPACPRTASTPSSAMCRSPISGWTITGRACALHDFFLAKSLDALKPGGVLALVTTHYTLDKQHPGAAGSISRSRRISWAPSACPRRPSRRKAPGWSRTSCACASAPLARRPPTPTPPGWRRPPSPSRAWTSPSTATSSSIRRWCSAPGAARTGSMPASRLQPARPPATSPPSSPPRSSSLPAGRVHGAPHRASAPGPCPQPRCPPGAPPDRRQFLCHGDARPSCRSSRGRPCR